MRIYSNIRLRVVERLHIWKGLDPNVYRVATTHKNTLTLQKPAYNSDVPLEFMTRYMWEYPDKQIGVCALDLDAWNVQDEEMFFDNAMYMPPDIRRGDIIYNGAPELY